MKTWAKKQMNKTKKKMTRNSKIWLIKNGKKHQPLIIMKKNQMPGSEMEKNKKA